MAVWSVERVKYLLLCLPGDDGLVCREDEMRCRSSGHCILRRYQCDGDNDCGDWEDELGCGQLASLMVYGEDGAVGTFQGHPIE